MRLLGHHREDRDWPQLVTDRCSSLDTGHRAFCTRLAAQRQWRTSAVAIDLSRCRLADVPLTVALRPSTWTALFPVLAMYCNAVDHVAIYRYH